MRGLLSQGGLPENVAQTQKLLPTRRSLLRDRSEAKQWWLANGARQRVSWYVVTPHLLRVPLESLANQIGLHHTSDLKHSSKGDYMMWNVARRRNNNNGGL